MRKQRVSIIGNGMATSRLLDELEARGALAHLDITVFGEEPGGAYNRIMLSKVLGGEPERSIVFKDDAWYAERGVRLCSGTTVSRLSTADKHVETTSGERHRYDVAVLATGSQPVVPPIGGMTGADGMLRPGVFVYRTMEDCRRMRAHARPGSSAVVLGGGLLGLEAAKVLSDLGLHVTIVHVAKFLMNAQLDDVGGDLLTRRIESCGIFVRAERTVERVVGTDDDAGVQTVVLDDGTHLPADLLVLACGVRPRVDVARASGLPINRGVVVNDALATEVPGVYAVGECVEHGGRSYGIVGPVYEQVVVLADILSGANPQARYRGSRLYTRLKVAGVDVASMGLREPELESDEVVEVIEEKRRTYRKLIVRDGRVVGAMMVGNTAAAASLVQAFDRGDPLPDDPLEALCAGLASAGAVPACDRMVCNCNRVTEAAIDAAIAGGAGSVEALGQATRAGTGCGSCRGELVALLTRRGAVRLAAAE